jgi:hypothetical protein
MLNREQTMTSTSTHQLVIVARPVDPSSITDDAALAGREHVLDHSELTDVVAEALAEAQRVHWVHGHTLWGDAAEAASLILQHVAAVCGAEPGHADSESKTLAVGGVSADHE